MSAVLASGSTQATALLANVHDSLLAPKHVRDEAGAQGGEPGATRHRGGDASLDIRARAATLDGALVEVAEVALGGDAARRCQYRTRGATARARDLHGTHGADVETEEAATDDGDGGDEVDVAKFLHHGGRCMLV